MTLAQAIVAFWKNTSLPGMVPGGLWAEENPTTSPTFPYQTFTVLGDVFAGKTTHGKMRLSSFEIQTFVKLQASVDPMLVLATIMETLDDEFDDAHIPITNRTLLRVQYDDARTFKDDTQVYRGLTEFSIVSAKGRN